MNALLERFRAAWEQYRSETLKWWQWTMVVFASCMQVFAYSWCLVCLVTKSYGAIAVSAFTWCWIALVVGVALRGDRDLFYDEQRNLISWKRFGWNVLKLAMYSAVAFTYMVYQYCAEQNKLNKPTRYEL
jgi:hypothetical protein